MPDALVPDKQDLEHTQSIRYYGLDQGIGVTGIVVGERDYREAAAAAKQAGGEANLNELSIRRDLAHRLLAGERPREAIDVVENTMREFTDVPDPIVFQLLMDKGQAHRELDELADAIEAFAAAVSIRPDDEAALDQMSLALMMAKRFAAANVYQARLHALQARQLPHRLADGLAMIWQRIPDIELDPAAVEWAWELADRSIWERSAWEAAAAWGQEARLLLRRWWQTAPPRQLGQLDELVEKPDLNELRAALVESNACFLVGAHVGPTGGACNFIRAGNRRFRTLGTADRDRAYGDTLIPIIPNSISSMRAVVNEIRKGTVIGLMADETSARKHLAIRFLGRNVELPPQIPKLIQKYHASSFWCCPLWRNGRIAIELERLPGPVQDEPRDLWCNRWFAAYLAKLEKVMRGQPENLGLFSGIWSNVNMTALRRRQKRKFDRRL